VISIIIPTLNEEEGIAKTLCSIPEDVKNGAEVIVVDVSTDLTPVIARRLGARVITARKKGKGSQMRQAVAESRGDILIFMDGDGTDPAAFIPKLVKKLETADLVLGCRNLSKMEGEEPKMRRIFQLYSMIAYPISHTLNLNVADPLAGFRAIRRKDWDRLDLKSNDFDIETEMNIKAIKNKLKIAEVPIPNLKRGGGMQGSKFLKSPKMWLKIFNMLVEYSREEKGK